MLEDSGVDLAEVGAVREIAVALKIKRRRAAVETALYL